MKLPVPIFFENKKIEEVEIKKPSSKTLFDTKKIIDSRGDYFAAQACFLQGTLDIEDCTEEKKKRMINEMPNVSAEYLTIQVMLLQYPNDDGVEGVYNCPRCGTMKICESSDGVDTRDIISELLVNYYDGENGITKPLSVELFDSRTKEAILSVDNITMRFPVLKDYIEAANKEGYNNQVDIQKRVYANCITHINGIEITKQQKYECSLKIIEKSNPIELNSFAKEFNYFGMQTDLKKICNHCGKEWYTKINTSNFFVSALR